MIQECTTQLPSFFQDADDDRSEHPPEHPQMRGWCVPTGQGPMETPGTAGVQSAGARRRGQKNANVNCSVIYNMKVS